MPLYLFKTKDFHQSCSFCQQGVELLVSFSDSQKQHCPNCGNEMIKVITSFSVGKGGSSKNLLKDSNLEKHGFTRLTKSGDGTYKVSGADPGGLGKIRIPKE